MLNNLGTALQNLGKHEEAAAMLEKSLTLNPLDPDVMVNLGMHWQEGGDLDRARSLYTRQVAHTARSTQNKTGHQVDLHIVLVLPDFRVS